MVNVNRVLSGTSGYTWLNGALLAQIKKVELKVAGNFEELEFCGDSATYNKFTGWSGEGTLTLQKIDSTVLSLMKNAYKTGVMPEIKIITKVTDASTGKSERVSVTNVVITEFFLAQFESKKALEEEIPIKFSNYDVLETI